MSQASRTDLLAFAYGAEGEPFVQLAASASLQPLAFDTGRDGEPFNVATPAGGPFLTGISSTTAAGGVVTGLTLALAGAAAAGAAGDVVATAGLEFALTGVGSDTTPGAPGVVIGLPGTGVAATGGVGATGAALILGLRGVAATGAAGDVIPDTRQSVVLSGVRSDTARAPVGVAVAVALSGNVLTGHAGAVTTSQALAGVSATGAAGPVVPVSPTTGVATTGGVGRPGAAVALAITGTPLHGFAGTMAGGNDKVFRLAGNTATGSAGRFATFLQALLGGVQAAGAVNGCMPTQGLGGVQAAGQAGNAGVGVGLAPGSVVATGLTGTVYLSHVDTGDGHAFTVTYAEGYTARIRSVERTVRGGDDTEGYTARIPLVERTVRRGDDACSVQIEVQDVLVEG